MYDIIQLIHSFEVNIRICQPENRDVRRGDADVKITFEGGQILMLKTYAVNFHAQISCIRNQGKLSWSCLSIISIISISDQCSFPKLLCQMDISTFF